MAVRARGQPCETFLADAGIASELLAEAGARVTADQYAALLRSPIERLDDEAIGFLSRPLKRGSYALIARSAIGAATVEVAMRRLARTFRLLQDDLLLQRVQDGPFTGIALRFVEPARADQDFLHELLLRVFWRLSAWLSGGPLPAARFDFAFARPAYEGSYGKVFPAPLRFGCAQSAFWFDAARLHDAVRRDETALRHFLAEAQANLIVPRRVDGIGARVRGHLQTAQPAWPDLGATAEALRMSPQTLQRRLALEGASFQSLKDELRRDLAILHLHTSATPLSKLADALGFADSAAFQRAFKGWTGSAPGVYRRGGV